MDFCEINLFDLEIQGQISTYKRYSRLIMFHNSAIGNNRVLFMTARSDCFLISLSMQRKFNDSWLNCSSQPSVVQHHQVLTSTAQYYHASTSSASYCPSIIIYHKSTCTALYWPSTTKYQSVPLHADPALPNTIHYRPVLSCINQFRFILTQ